MAEVLREVGGHGAPIDSGWMSCDIPGSWATYAAGIGHNGPVPASTIDTLVDFYQSCGRPARVQVTQYQHPSLLAELQERGFKKHDQDTVLAIDLSMPKRTEDDSAPQVIFKQVDPGSPSEVSAFIASQAAGFYDDGPAPTGLVPITQRVAQVPRAMLWLIEHDGQIVGSGGLEIFEDMGVLIAGCVHPQARRQGLHRKFMEFRVAEAQRRGASYAAVASVPDGPTQRNAAREGFKVAYTHTTFQLS